MVSPGFVTVSGAAEINAALARLRRLEEAFFQTPRVDFDQLDRPWIKLTGRYSGTGEYAWTEADFTTAGAFYDKVGGRSGTVNGLAGATVTYSPAVEMNGEVISTFPHYVRAEFAVLGTTGRRYYFKTSSPAAGVELIGSYVPDSQSIGSSGSHTYDTALDADESGLYLVTGNLVLGQLTGGDSYLLANLTDGSTDDDFFPKVYAFHLNATSAVDNGVIVFSSIWQPASVPATLHIAVSNGPGGSTVIFGGNSDYGVNLIKLN